MRFLIVVMCYFLVSANIAAQDSISRYLNNNWEKTCKSKASYYRVVNETNGSKYHVKDYSLEGKLAKAGYYADKKLRVKDGLFITYFPDGHVKSKINYKENQLHGSYAEYYIDGIKNFQGNYNYGKKDGMWKWYFEQGTISWYEQWRNDTLVHNQCWNEKGQELESDFPTQVDAFIAGGTRSLYFFIEDNFTYPTSFQNKSVKIKIEVLVHVAKSGDITSVKVKGAKYDWVEPEIQRVFGLMPRWYPALDHLRPMDSVVEIPLMFRKYPTQQ